MENEKVWATRVEQWRKSGLSSVAFAEGKSFTGGGLRHMAFRLRSAARKPRVMRIARVVRARAGASVSAEAAVVVVVGGARIEVGVGASQEVLTTVLAALAERRRE